MRVDAIREVMKRSPIIKYGHFGGVAKFSSVRNKVKRLLGEKNKFLLKKKKKPVDITIVSRGATNHL